jgi:hypothetical protein
MELTNITVLLDVIMRGMAQLQTFGALISKARSENRDVTRAELDALFADDDHARAALQAAIEAHR